MHDAHDDPSHAHDHHHAHAHDHAHGHHHPHGHAHGHHDDHAHAEQHHPAHVDPVPRPPPGLTLWLDCFAGMSGDMLLGALLDVGAPRAVLDDVLSRLAIAGVSVHERAVHRAGLRARRAHVHTPEEHAHRHLADVRVLLDRAIVDERARARAHAVFTRLAEAEAAVHGIAVERVHFHEVGAADAIVDIAGACALLTALGVSRVVASPVRTGTGSVRAAHGELPVPTPATARLLVDKPSFGGDVPGEACTPTGAALLATLVDAWGGQPLGRTRAIGAGAGARNPATHANVVRAIVVEEVTQPTRGLALVDERLAEIECHVDDMTGEALGFLSETLLAGPARDVAFTPVTGKKSRPAIVVRVLVGPTDVDDALALLFRHSSTLGARVSESRRVRLVREDVVVETLHGRVRGKRTLVDGRPRVSPEHDDVAAIARAHALTLDEALSLAHRAFVAAGHLDEER